MAGKRVSRSLGNRMYGYEMSGFEYSLFFKYDDMGYVRYDGRSKQLFSLDPSPFWKDDRKIVYVIEDDNKPRENQLIKVQVKEKERKAIQLPNGQLEWVHIKYVGRWEYVNPSKIIPEKKMSHDEYVDFFQIPFKPVSESPDFLNELSYSMAMYTASSHVPGSNQKGGIDAAVLADDKNWKIFGKLMNIIPRDFNSTKSEHFYEKTKKQTPIAPVNSTEVNVTYLEPHEIFVHIPFPLISKVEGGTFYQEYLKDMAPSVRGYMLDTLLFQPEISPKVESYIEDKIYEAVEEFEKMGHTSYRQDLGSSVHKFSTAISRLHLSNNVTKQDVDNGMEAWKNMYHGSMIIHRVDTNTKRMNRISDEGRLFYTELCKVFGSGTNITIDDIPQNTSIPTWKIDTVLQELGRASLIYFLPNENNSIRIIDFGVFK